MSRKLFKDLQLLTIYYIIFSIRFIIWKKKNNMMFILEKVYGNELDYEAPSLIFLWFKYGPRGSALLLINLYYPSTFYL